MYHLITIKYHLPFHSSVYTAYCYFLAVFILKFPKYVIVEFCKKMHLLNNLQHITYTIGYL